MLKINKKIAKPISYGANRSLKSIKYIVIHYTGNNNDTAKNNADYFAAGNKAEVGAHFFIDKKGEVWNSVEIGKTAWAVGGFFTKKNGAGEYYRKCTNANSVSIELCDCTKDTNWEQMLACRKLVQYIQKKCPNAKTVIRHWDVNGKTCPAPMVGKNNKKWESFYEFITVGYPFEAIVTEKAIIRTSPKISANNKIKSMPAGTKINIVQLKGNFGRLKKKTEDKKNRYITLNKVKKI